MLLQEMTGLPILSDLPEALQTEVASYFHLRQYERGCVVFAEGEPGRAVYFVRSGRIKVSRTTADGEEQIIGVFGAGEPFGLVVLLDGSPYPATSTVLGDSWIWSVNCQDLMGFLSRHPAVMPAFLKEVGERLRRSQDRAHALSTGSVHQRLATYLLQLAEEEGRPEVWLPLTRSELGSYLGATRETISRGLTDFRRAGAMELLKDGRLKLVPVKLKEWL
ncbi:MAG TPA: Crp/Fnr family transcriptional regulator [Symbiobacteriaceae bacterium]|nr:Crp/Fnr family transcriptional regulator [Symbiobacteriaceae bacterium]